MEFLEYWNHGKSQVFARLLLNVPLSTSLLKSFSFFQKQITVEEHFKLKKIIKKSQQIRKRFLITALQ